MLEFFEGVNELLGLAVGSVAAGCEGAGAAGGVDDEKCSGLFGELDELEGEDADRGAACGMGELEEVDDASNGLDFMHAREDAELSLRPEFLEGTVLAW